MNLASRLSLCLAFALGLASPPDPTPAPKSPDQVQANLLTPVACFRTRLTLGDDDRTWTYAHSYGGGLGLTWTLGTSSAQSWPGSAVEEHYDSAIHGGWTLPEGTKPGTYQLNPAAGFVPIEVVSAPKRKQARIAANEDSLKNARKALSQGFLEVILEPGEHVWPDMLALPSNAILRGYGATVRRSFVTNFGGNWPSLQITGPDISVYGVTFVYDRPGQVFYCNPPMLQSGLVVADCTFKRCNFGFYLGGCLIRDCVFEQGGCTIAPGGLYLRCRWEGPSSQHAWAYWSGMGPVMMIDATFRDTDRAVIFNSSWGPIEDFLCVGLACRGIDRQPNGNEVALVEGANVFRRATYLHTRVSGCNGPLFQFDQVAGDISIRDLAVVGPSLGIMFWGRDIQRVTVQDFELSGCGIYLGPGARDCKLIGGTAIGFVPTRGNQSYRNTSPYCDSRRAVLWAEGPNAATNILDNVDVIAAPAGVTAVTGFKQKEPVPPK